MKNAYAFMDNVSSLYGMLEDELSKKIFLERLRYDVTDSADSALRLFALTGALTEAEITEQFTWREAFKALRRDKKEIVIYGTGVCGHRIARLIQTGGADFDAFCDRTASQYPEGLFGKPVMLPETLLERGKDACVLIASMDYFSEILDFLITHQFPRDHILPFFNKFDNVFKEMVSRQYFEFPEFYPKGTAFVDGGCFDGTNSLRFAEWSGGEYSKIIAFEPDKANFLRCQKLAEDGHIARMEVFQAGLSDTTEKNVFAAAGGKSGHIVDASQLGSAGTETIWTVALDDIAENERIGFIKMDIEGAEYSALLGAKHVLQRDKPLLAICVYHRPGDVLAIMGLVHELNPEYRFWLRHYTPLGFETVLYAV